MSKFLWSGIAIAFISSIGIAQAQLPPNSKPSTPQSSSISITSTPLKATDLPLVTRATGKFAQTDKAETESQIEIDLQNDKGSNKYAASVKTIAQVGRKFYSELIINRVGEKSKTKYTIVSDGKKNWIYQPDLRQYAELSNDDLNRAPIILTIGVSSFLFTSMDEKQRQDLITDILGEHSRSISLENSKSWQLHQQQIDSRNLSVYTYSENYDSAPKLSFFIDPKTATLERIDSKFKGNYTHIPMTGEIIEYNCIEMTEKIIKRNPQPKITDKTFTFSPPKGVKKVTSLQIGLFGF